MCLHLHDIPACSMLRLSVQMFACIVNIVLLLWAMILHVADPAIIQDNSSLNLGAKLATARKKKLISPCVAIHFARRLAHDTAL